MRSWLQNRWLLAVALVALSACSNQVADWKRLETHGEKTTGSVVNADCSDHGKISYRFSVNGQQITNSSYGYAERPCSLVRTGDPIVIYYDPQSPAKTNTLMTPSAAVCFYEARAMTPFLFAGILLLAAAVQVVRKGNPFKEPPAQGDEH